MEEILSQIGEMTPVLIMGLGLAIGLEHAFEPDHVAAVSTQVSKGRFMQKSTKQIIKSGTIRSSTLGAFWGAGQTTTLVLMGLLVYALAVKIEQNICFELGVNRRNDVDISSNYYNFKQKNIQATTQAPTPTQ